MNIRAFAAALAATVVLPLGVAQAADLEVTHWWTSGGEAAAVAEFAKAFDATGNKWVDGAIAGGGSTARGNPTAKLKFNKQRILNLLNRDCHHANGFSGLGDFFAIHLCTLRGKIRQIRAATMRGFPFNCPGPCHAPPSNNSANASSPPCWVV